MDVRKPAIMIISTQTPNPEKSNAGGTGRIIQELTEGGFVHVHRSKLPTEAEVEIFKEHLQPGGWVIITGHGETQGTVAGSYTPEDNSAVMDIYVSADEYAKLILASNVLKSGDHINILLYVCFGAASLGNRIFAEQLGQCLSTQGISSHIVASTKEVRRIFEYNDDFCDIKGELLMYRAKPGSVWVFSTAAGSADKAAETTSYNLNCRVVMTKAGVCFGAKRVPLTQVNEEARIVDAIYALGFGIPKEILFNMWRLTLDETVKCIRSTPGGIVIRKSSQKNNVTVTFVNKKENNIANWRYPLEEGDAGSLKIKIDPEELEKMKMCMEFDSAEMRRGYGAEYSFGGGLGLFRARVSDSAAAGRLPAESAAPASPAEKSLSESAPKSSK